jgi:hypothetical protein
MLRSPTWKSCPNPAATACISGSGPPTGPISPLITTNVRENRTFIYFSRHFRQQGCPVPEIYLVNESYTIYFQEDFGDTVAAGRTGAAGA